LLLPAATNHRRQLVAVAAVTVIGSERWQAIAAVINGR